MLEGLRRVDQIEDEVKISRMNKVLLHTHEGYERADKDAIPDDTSGRNFFPMKCLGTNVGVVYANGTFAADTTAMTFPKCLLQ